MPKNSWCPFNILSFLLYIKSLKIKILSTVQNHLYGMDFQIAAFFKLALFEKWTFIQHVIFRNNADKTADGSVSINQVFPRSFARVINLPTKNYAMNNFHKIIYPEKSSSGMDLEEKILPVPDEWFSTVLLKCLVMTIWYLIVNFGWKIRKLLI